MSAWRTIYVFVSSTFRDMQAERDVLVKKVFPKLRARLEPYRLRIVEIDLRWGITEEEEKHDKVLELCLQQVDRANPYFLGLLGERYGSVPRRITPQALSDYPWLQTSANDRTSLTELEIIQGVLRVPLDKRRALFYFRHPAPLEQVPHGLRSYFLDDTADLPHRHPSPLSGLEGRLLAAGHTPDVILPRLLAGEEEPAELRAILTPHDRLSLVKERLRRADLVRMNGYSWQFAGLRIRWNLARLVLADPDLLEQLREAAADNLITPDEYAELLRNPDLAKFLQDYATVSMDGLESFAQQVEADLWSRLEQEPEVQSAKRAGFGSEAPLPQSSAQETRKQLRFLAWVRHHFKGMLPAEFDLLPPEQANELLLLTIERSPSASRMLVNASRLWQDRWDSGGADDFGLAANWEEERDGHRRFAENRLDIFVPRPDVDTQIEDYLNDPAGRILVIRGGPGTGKSALMAKIWEDRGGLSSHGESRSVAHFVGATPGSGSLLGVLRRLIVELQLIPEAELDLHASNVDALAEIFASSFSRIDPQRHDCLILDALDQIDAAHHAHELHWLPSVLPPHFRMIVSLATDQDQPHSRSILAALSLRAHVELDVDKHPLSTDSRLELIQQVPSLAAKSLSSEHIQALLENPATVNPLYLKVVLEELRGFGAFQLLMARIREFEPADTPAKLFEQVIEWLSPDFDPLVVQTVLLALACARHGMSEQELFDLVAATTDATTEAQRNSRWDEAAALLRYLQPYLQWRGRLLDFHHRALRIAVERRFGADAESERRIHRKLAEMFELAGRESQPPWNDRYARSIAETVHHLLAGQDWEGLVRLLNEDTFLFRKGRSPYHHDLAGEVARALEEAPLEFAVAVAGAFARCASQFEALDETTHNALAQLAYRDEKRFLELLPYLWGRSEPWRAELLKTSVALIGVQEYSAAEKLLQRIAETWDGDEPMSSTRVTYYQNMTVLLTSMGRHEDARQYCLDGIDAAREINDNINVAILQSTLITVYGALGQHAEAADLTVEMYKNHQDGTGIDRVLPRAIYGGFRSLVILGRMEEAERLIRDGLDYCQGRLGAGMDYAFLTATWAEHCLGRNQSEKALDDLKIALSKTRDAYPEDSRPGLYVLLIRCLLSLQRLPDAQSVYKSAMEFPWSERGRQKLTEMLQASQLATPESPEIFSRHGEDYATRGNPTSAESWFLTGLAQFPQDERLNDGYRKLLKSSSNFPLIDENWDGWLDRINRVARSWEAHPDWDATELLYRRGIELGRNRSTQWPILMENFAAFLHQYRQDLVQSRRVYEELFANGEPDSILLTKYAALQISEGALRDAVETLVRARECHADWTDAFAIRIPLLRGFVALALGENPDLFLGQVKSVVESGGQLSRWQVAAVLDALRDVVSTEDFELCHALVSLLNGSLKLEHLTSLPRWSRLPAVPLTAAWP